ncbi:hypothetical protein SLEP1_g22502 [Rubroshorea leprosula]|uniref:CASP-like protein n=1 Tax=Rubroshorea leprosula TaxID=152421 RepID=A0AAV5JFG8_9ROSI|nr:hypothetical protein SLEP1_g22502 [Rubroshorea leprosula]
MAPQNGEKPSSAPAPCTKINRVLLLLRLLAFSATAAATIVMALNKQTKTFVVATIGTTSIKATLTAKFNDTPANVFFVVANGLGSLHNLLMILLDIFGRKLDYKGFRLPGIAILDVLNVVLVSAGVNAAAFMADLAKHGNSHARWDKICDRFGKFCDHGGGALISSFIGLFLMLLICAISIIKLLKPNATTSHINISFP